MTLGMRSLVAVILVWTVAGCVADTGTSAVSEGVYFACPSSDGLPDVLAWVGRVEPVSAILGPFESGPDPVVAHLQLVADEPEGILVQHSPFAPETLGSCRPIDQPFAADPAGFDEGYQTYADAVRDEGAGFFTLSPAETYWAMLGVVKQIGG